jgi:hypothetical protein
MAMIEDEMVSTDCEIWREKNGRRRLFNAVEKKIMESTEDDEE